MDMMAQIKPLLATRAELYDLLRRTFITEPTSDFEKFVDAYDFDSFPFVDESDDIRKGIALIKKWNENRIVEDGGHAGACEALREDYTRLFIGPDTLPAPPWESAYMNEERLLFQEETLQVRRTYLKYQFIPVHYLREADDHLGLELDFMFRLSVMTWEKFESLEAGADSAGDGLKQDPSQATALRDLLMDQKLFLEQHLLKWVPALSKDIISAARTEFYQGMAHVLLGFLQLDLEALEELLGIELPVASSLQ